MNDTWHPEEIDLSAYLDGELANQQRAEVTAHLEGCAACRRALAELALVFERLESLPEAAPTGDLSQMVLAALRSQAESVPPAARTTGAARPSRATGFARSWAGWVALAQVGLAAAILWQFGAQTWGVWSRRIGLLADGWLEQVQFAARLSLPPLFPPGAAPGVSVLPALSLSLAAAGQTLAEWAASLTDAASHTGVTSFIGAERGWQAALMIVQQPLPWDLPARQAALILAAAGLVWLLGSMMLLRGQVGPHHLEGGNHE